MSTSCLFEVIWLQLPVHASASGQSLLSCRLNLDFAWHKYHPNLDHHKSSIRKVRCFQFGESRISLCIRYWSHHSEREMWFFFLALSRQLVQSRPSLHSNEFVRSCQCRTRWVPPKCICGCKSWFERICGRRWPLDKFGVSNLQFKGRTSYESLKKLLELDVLSKHKSLTLFMNSVRLYLLETLLDTRFRCTGKLPVPVLVSTSRPLFIPEKRLGYRVALWPVIMTNIKKLEKIWRKTKTEKHGVLPGPVRWNWDILRFYYIFRGWYITKIYIFKSLHFPLNFEISYYYHY